MGQGRLLLTTWLLIAVPLAGWAQDSQPLPAPRPVAPAPAPAPPPQSALSPRALMLARMAAESNFWAPPCDPPGPTPGLWGGCPCAHHYSWQEWAMASRDCLEWCFSRPTCSQGMRPAANASLYDWMTQWLPYR